VNDAASCAVTVCFVRGAALETSAALSATTIAVLIADKPQRRIR